MSGSEEDDGELRLPSDTLAILNDFYAEKQATETQYGTLNTRIANGERLSMKMFTEDWNASQFWYSDETAILLAKELLKDATSETRIAVISAPSVFVQLKNLTAPGSRDSPHLRLLEYDQRFDVFEEFTHYDFESPIRLPVDLKGSYHRVLCDPPFLSDDCQTKVAITVKWLLSPKELSERNSSRSKTILCTGERMEGLILRLYPGIHITSFEPQHEQDRLSNAFRCYANYEGPSWSYRNSEDK